MTAQTAVLIVVFVAIVLACAVAGPAGWYYLRRQTLRRKFGPEYDRAVAEFTADA
jgi:hypothetical protein